MTNANTFLARMQPIIDAIDDADKEKLQALIALQDAIERDDVPPQERARARQRLLHGDVQSRPPRSTP